MASHNASDFAGLFPACPTLLLEGETLDEEAQRRLFRANADAGANGFWMFGSGGEGVTIDDATRVRTLEILFDELGEDFPVIAGISAEGTKRTVERWNPIAHLPVKGVFAVPPIYYGYTQDELYDYFVSLIDLTGKPVFPYHNPFFTKNRMTVATMQRLAQTDGIAGTKDSTKEIAELQELVWNTPDDFVVFQGQEELIAASFAMGARSVVSVVSASATALFADIVAAGTAGDLARSIELQGEVNAYLVEIGTSVAQTEGDFVGAVKKRLASQGYGSAVLTAPWRPRS